MNNNTAERAGDSVLGTLLAFYKPELVTVMGARGVVWSDFPHDRQRVVYRAILALHKDGVHVDVLTVEAFLQSHGRLERAGGPGYLAVCVESSSASAFRDHAWLVAGGARWARLLSAWECLGRAIEHRDDVALREAVRLVKRDVLEGAPPKLHVVKDEVA